MIINVFGSTKNEVHFGCKSLTHGLEELLLKKYSNISVIDHTLHKYLSPGFEETFRVRKKVGRKMLLSLLKKSFISGDGVELPEGKSTLIDFQNWKKSVNTILQDNFIRKKNSCFRP